MYILLILSSLSSEKDLEHELFLNADVIFFSCIFFMLLILVSGPLWLLRLNVLCRS